MVKRHFVVYKNDFLVAFQWSLYDGLLYRVYFKSQFLITLHGRILDDITMLFQWQTMQGINLDKKIYFINLDNELIYRL